MLQKRWKFTRPVAATLAVVAVMLLAGATFVAAQFRGLSGSTGVVDLHGAFLTGNRFRRLERHEQWVYASGLVDGMLLAPLFDAPERSLDRLHRCLGTGANRMTDEQLAAIFTRYLNQHPEKWNQSAHGLFWTALSETCP